MKLHDTQSTHGMKVLEITNFDGEQEFSDRKFGGDLGL